MNLSIWNATDKSIQSLNHNTNKSKCHSLVNKTNRALDKKMVKMVKNVKMFLKKVTNLFETLLTDCPGVDLDLQDHRVRLANETPHFSSRFCNSRGRRQHDSFFLKLSRSFVNPLQDLQGPGACNTTKTEPKHTSQHGLRSRLDSALRNRGWSATGFS